MATILTRAGAQAFREDQDPWAVPEPDPFADGPELDTARDETDPEPFRISVHDLDTRPKCVTCGRDMDILSAFDRGVRHCLKVLYDKFLDRMSPDEARNLVNWVKSDPGLD